MRTIGIDLGTTFSAIASVDENGKPQILINREGERVTPSVVNFDENGNPIVGATAKQLSVEQPLDTVQYVKRNMGDPNWKFIDSRDKNYNPEEISAIILKRLKEDAESILNDKISGAVVTVPAYFDDAQRKSTQDAGAIAGLNVLKVINEPTAAALAYGFGGKEGGEQTVLVYDLGGGTFDVTMMKISGETIGVVSTGGDKNLGGFDWDNKLMVYLNDEYKKINGVDILSIENAEADLRDKAEKAKKALTLMETTSVTITNGGKRAKIEVTRELFNSLTQDLVKRTLDIAKSVLEEGKMKWSDVNKILLVGGSTRMPAIKEALQKETGILPSSELNPDEVVAIGAAIQAHLCILTDDNVKTGQSIPDSFKNLQISDVNSHSMGILTLDGNGGMKNSIVMPKNTKIPGKTSNTFSTSVDNQTSLEVEVTEGEETDPQLVKNIGKAVLMISPYPKGAPIQVEFEYDDSGIVHVHVTDKTINKYLGEVRIERKSNMNESQISLAKQKISQISID